MTKYLLAYIIALFCLKIQQVQADPACKNHQNQNVDWFIALKFPSGTRYAYCDSLNCDKLAIQTTLLDDLDVSPLFNTLKQIESVKSEEYATVFWNDEPPTFDVSESYAHSKGLIGTGKNNGFIIVHSTPKFPLTQDGKIVMEIKSNQTIYGQHYFCISTASENIEQIAAAYNIDWPYAYDGNVPTNLSNFVYLQKMISRVRDNEYNYQSVNFNTINGIQMIKFAKSGKWQVPFYDNVPAYILQTSLLVESWRSTEESDCNQEYTVINNEIISFKSDSVTYKETVDHSKYAISENDSLPYVCLGDINRAKSQWKRGGGTICFANKNVHSNFKNIMVTTKTCPQKAHNFIYSD